MSVLVWIVRKGERTVLAVQISNTKNVDITAQWASRGTKSDLARVEVHGWNSEGGGSKAEDGHEGGSHICGLFVDTEKVLESV